MNAEWALDRAFDEFCAVFAEVGDEYLRERRGDVADVVGRLRRNLLPAPQGRARARRPGRAGGARRRRAVAVGRRRSSTRR